MAPTPAAEPDPPVAEETVEPVEPGPPAAVPDSALRVSEPDAPVAGDGPESAEPADPVVTPPEPGTAVSPPPATRPDASVSQDAHGPAEQAASAASPEPQAAVSPPAGAEPEVPVSEGTPGSGDTAPEPSAPAAGEPEVPDVPAATVDAEATETFVRPAQAWFGTGSDTAARRPPAVRPPHPGTPTVVTVPGAGDSPNPDAEETDTFVVRAADRRASAATRGEAVPSAPDAAAPVDGSPAEPEHVPVPGGYEQRIIALAPVPVSRWGRALFAATGGRLNLG
ncbi:hypothetical protein [Nocardiopsis sp. YSL2]|uniref:hypothetical protein n=1 Tax=Nocardiopsis sp. YSL2 TaxID=2939492 RepID=UPI0026F42770|nr:hypothetical protein [Nocardiopsis sp. YSL2]